MKDRLACLTLSRATRPPAAKIPLRPEIPNVRAVRGIPTGQKPKGDPLTDMMAVYTATDDTQDKLQLQPVLIRLHKPFKLTKVYQKRKSSHCFHILLSKINQRSRHWYFAGLTHQQRRSKCRSSWQSVSVLGKRDTNDNCPSLASNMEYICSGKEILSITQVDQDGDLNSAPFIFGPVGKQYPWAVEDGACKGT